MEYRATLYFWQTKIDVDNNDSEYIKEYRSKRNRDYIRFNMPIFKNNKFKTYTT